jgi:hypothetical protein
MYKTRDRDHREYFHVVEGHGLHLTDETLPWRRRGD